MRGFVYFLPGAEAVTRKRVEDGGLAYLLDGPEGSPAYAPTTAGPGGAPGVVFCFGGAHPALPKDPAWSKVPGTPAWFAPSPEGAPGPEDLARRRLIDGHDVELADGRFWRVPVARLLSGETLFPRALNWDGATWQKGDVRPAYRSLWAAACRIWDTIFSADGAPVTLNDEATTAAIALACNYRLGPAEISALGLLDTRSEVEVLKALVDLPALEELKKKPQFAALLSGPGGKAS